MYKKIILLIPVISSLVFSMPASGAVTATENLRMLDEINGLVFQIESALNEMRSAREAQRLRDPRDNPEIDGPNGLIGTISSRLSALRSSLSAARPLAGKTAEISLLNTSLRNATALLGEMQIFLRDTALGNSFKNPAEKIVNIIDAGGLLDKLRNKLNLLGAVSYRVSISGHTQDVVVDVAGRPVLFKEGETSKVVTLSGRLPNSTPINVTALDRSFTGQKAVIVSRAPTIAAAPNCVTDTKMNFTLTISSGSAIISGGRGKIEVDEKQYTPEILFTDALKNNPEIFERNQAVGVVAKNTLRKLPSAMMFTHTASGDVADLYILDGGKQVKKIIIRRDSVENLNEYYEARDLKNLDKIFLLGQYAEGSSARNFLSQFSNLSEPEGYPVLIMPQNNGVGLLAKTSRFGSYLKIADLITEKLSFAYASKDGKLAIVISSDDLTRGSVERIIGPVTKEKSEYRMGLKAFTQGLWRIAAPSRRIGTGIRLISLAFAQPVGGGGDEGDGAIYIEAPTIAYEPPPSFESAPTPPSDSGLTPPTTPVTPPQVTPPTGVSGGTPSKPPRETGIDYAVGLVLKITEKGGVSVQVVDPESKNWDPYAEYPDGGPTCGKDFKTPGLGVNPQDLDGGGGFQPPPKRERSLLERLFNPNEDTTPVQPPIPTDDLRPEPPQIQTPGIFQNIYNLFQPPKRIQTTPYTPTTPTTPTQTQTFPSLLDRFISY